LAPSGLAVAAGTPSESAFNLTWTDTNAVESTRDESGFKIMRSLNDTSGFALVGSTGQGVTAWSDLGLTCFTTYYYRVIAYNSLGDAASYAAGNRATTACAAGPLAPTALTATAGGPVSIDLSWTDNATNETGFAVERSPNGTSSWTLVGSPGIRAGTGSVSYTDTGLTAQTQYYYRVKATGSPDSTYAGPANATTTAFPIITVSTTTTNLVYSFQTVAGKNYRLIRNTVTPQLSDLNWADAGQAVLTGSGAVMNFTVAKPASGQIFYTVEFKQ
jgi:hypothetical protein